MTNKYNAIILNRGEGKTKALVEHCIKTGATLVVANTNRKQFVSIDIAKHHGSNVKVNMITYAEFLSSDSRTMSGRIRNIVIDDMETLAEVICQRFGAELDTYSLTP